MKLPCCDKQRLCWQIHHRISSSELSVKRRYIENQGAIQSVSTITTSATSQHRSKRSAHTDHTTKTPYGQLAKQKEADREFFADLLSSAATKRDAKAYLTRLKSPPKATPLPPRTIVSGSYVNLGNLFPGIRAAEQSPVFSQGPHVEAEFEEEEEVLHVALVKICDVGSLSENLLLGIGETLSQLNRLSLSPCVIVQSTTEASKAQLGEDADSLAAAINAYGETVARRVDNIFTTGNSTSAKVAERKLLLRPLRRGQIPVLTPITYDEDNQRISLLSSEEAMLAVTREFAGLNIDALKKEREITSTVVKHIQRQVVLSKVITIDSAGGIPSSGSSDGRHVFLNLEQEYDDLKAELESRSLTDRNPLHISNLELVQRCLQILPPSSSGLMTTYAEAANSSRVVEESAVSNVGTRRQKNALIHNLLTDKPAYSSSLPSGRLHHDPDRRNSNMSYSSFVKRGMPLTILPDPALEPWAPNNARLKLTDPRIDLGRLVHLIEDSFNRKLDVDDYLRRVNDRIAGVIIAGEYEGGALLTWETPPDAPDAAPVPYLDKFAVLKRAQGAGGVADIVFNAMVRMCFPTGVCWRSRKDNPVNKWYFERSRGTWKIPDMNWTMFWTTPEVELHSALFKEYESVCRGVTPSWADKKKIAD